MTSRCLRLLASARSTERSKMAARQAGSGQPPLSANCLPASLEEFDEFAAARAMLDQGMDLAGDEVDAGQRRSRCVELAPQHWMTLNSTRRSTESLASSLAVPTINSRDPRPVAIKCPTSSLASASIRSLTYPARRVDSRSLTAARPLALVWPTISRHAFFATVRSAIFSSQVS